MRAIGIIPARMASTRFPGKPLAELAGRPVVEWVWLAAKKSRNLFQAFVATPDPEIVEACATRGMPYIVTARTCRNGTERCHDAMRQLAQREPDEVVLNIQGDEPLLRPESIDALIDAFLDPAVKIASLCHRPAGRDEVRDPNRVKVISKENGDAFSFSRRAPRAAVGHRIHVGVYAFRRRILTELARLPVAKDLEQTAWLRAGYGIRMVEIDYRTCPIDRPEDLAQAEIALLRP